MYSHLQNLTFSLSFFFYPLCYFFFFFLFIFDVNNILLWHHIYRLWFSLYYFYWLFYVFSSPFDCCLSVSLQDEGKGTGLGKAIQKTSCCLSGIFSITLLSMLPTRRARIDASRCERIYMSVWGDIVVAYMHVCIEVSKG